MASIVEEQSRPPRPGIKPAQVLRFLLGILREGLGLITLMLFAICIATLPPLKVQAGVGWLGFRFQINWADWSRGIKRLVTTFTSGQPLRNVQGQPLGTVVTDAWEISLILLGGALILALLLGVLKGVWDFRQLQRRRIAFGPLLSAAIQGMPDFFLLMLVQLFLIIVLRETGELLLPVAWTGTATWQHYMVPLFCLMIYPLNGVARVVTTGLQEVWNADFIRTGRAKGVQEQVLLWKHAMRNVMVQLLDNLPLLLSLSFANLLILEYLCNIPGLTKLLRFGIGQEADTRFTNNIGFTSAIPVDSVIVALSGMAIGLTFWALWGVIRLMRPLVDPRLRGR